MNGWTPERRKRQAQLIKIWQPWQHSTGAKTAEGKAKVARNAFKGGMRAELRELRELLRDQRDMLERYRL